MIPAANLSVNATVTIAGFTGTGSGLYNGPHTVLSVTATSTTTTFTYRPTNNGVSNTAFAALGKANVSAALPAVQGLTLAPTYSVLTSTTGYPGTGNTSANPNLADLYCNGSRVVPEFPGVINPPSVKNLQVSATVDEGNNYVNMRYGPLYLGKPTDSTGTAYIPFGNYHIQVGPAVNTGTTVLGVTHDFDGDPRPIGSAYDIGADELTGQ